ncbi:inducible alternative oxidase 2 [Pestalotiopsis sp. IQ-011]
MANTSNSYHGSIIALEGSGDAVSTQLRLLPSSPKILILPPLQQFMGGDGDDSSFDAQSYILRTHEACCTRIEKAHAFLRDSTVDNKRLVFMNGGTASARMNCIASIGKHSQGGDISKAESTFEELVRHGVAGLQKGGHNSEDKPDSPTTAPPPSRKTATPKDEYADRMAEAIRAADALYRETASLQPNNDLDLFATNHQRSKSAPIHPKVDDSAETTTLYTFVARDLADEAIFVPERPSCDTAKVPHGNNLIPQPLNLPTGLEAFKPRAILDNSILHQMVDQSSPRWAKKQYRKSYTPSTPAMDDVFSPQSGTFGSLPKTPTVVFGEARLVDVRTSPSSRKSQQHTRTSTLLSQSDDNSDSDTALSYHRRKLPLRVEDHPEPVANTSVMSNRTNLRRPPPLSLDLTTFASVKERGIYVDKGTSPSPRLSAIESPQIDRSSYIDRGVDAADELSLLSAAVLSDDETTFGAALPLYEDLVIHLDDESDDTPLRRVFADLLSHLYPSTVSGKERTTEGGVATSVSNSNPVIDVKFCNPDSTLSPACSTDDYDHPLFETHGNYLELLSPGHPRTGKVKNKKGVVDAPPTPARTPPFSATAPHKSLHEIKANKSTTAIGVQNSLRLILNIYFSPNEPGYKQFIFPLLPELSSMWKPVFREAEEGITKKDNRKIDLILAIGAQKGVQKDFVSAVAASLENLATKPSGVTRSGRLDLKYLIAKAMQSYTCLPLAKQTRDNPFTNPKFLATLMVPHLETYLAAHNETRFLILEYPAEHHATVLALQKLVGTDLLKVTGIVSADSPEAQATSKSPSPISRSADLGRPSLSSRYSTRSVAETPLISQANFVLASSATNSEIATLISTIWKILIEISPYYIPEVSPRSASSMEHRLSYINLVNPTASQTTLSNESAPLARARAMVQPQEAPSGVATSEAVNLTPTPTTPKKGTKRSSLSIRSSKSKRLTNSPRTRLQKLIASERGATTAVAGEGVMISTSPVSSKHNSSYFDVSEDEDGWLYQHERKYVPMFIRKPDIRKGNSRKALKFLGLA